MILLRTIPLPFLILFVSLLIGGRTAQAIVVGGSGSAFGLSVELSGALTLDSGDIASVSGAAPTTFNLAGNVLSSNPTASSGAIEFDASTGAIDTTTTSDVDGTAGTKTTTSTATTNGLSISLDNGLTNILSLTADTVVSSGSVTGDFPSFSESGSTTLTNPSLSVNGVAVSVSANPAANTEVFNAGGIRIVLNEQIVTGDGSFDRGITVNAIHITFTSVPLGLDTLSGDIIVSQSFASLTASPEPASLLLAGVGFGSVGFIAHRRRRKRKQSPTSTGGEDQKD